ncbi:MAG: HEPN domain-containing protein [Candidatus Hadarchaeota archaeon]
MSDEVEGNLERARDRLDAARLLLKNDKYEDAVNRAYYSMYHSAMALLRAKGVSPRTHRGLIGEFGRRFVREDEVNRRYSTMLSHAESLRESADYGLKSEIKREDAREVVENAEDFLKMAVNQFSE